MDETSVGPGGQPEPAPATAPDSGEHPAGGRTNQAFGGGGDTADPAPSTGQHTPPSGQRRLRRSRWDRMLAGVAGGLADYLDIDPVVPRVAFVVLAVFGGIGLLLYLLCWIVMPEEGEHHSPAERLLGHSRRGGLALQGSLVAAAMLVAAAIVARDHADDVALLVVVVAVALLLYWRAQRADSATPTGQGPGGPAPAGAARNTGGLGWPAGPGPRQSPRHTRVGAIGFSVVCVLVGVLTALNHGGVIEVSARGVLALVLATTGVALLVGAFWGRARGLIVLGAPVMLVLMLAGGALGQWDTHRVWAPATLDTMSAEYRLGAGVAELDLRSVDFTGADAQTAVRLGAGALLVDVPPHVDVAVHSSVRMGWVRAFGTRVGGADKDVTFTDLGRDGPGGGRLEIWIRLAVGVVEVTR